MIKRWDKAHAKIRVKWAWDSSSGGYEEVIRHFLNHEGLPDLTQWHQYDTKLEINPSGMAGGSESLVLMYPSFKQKQLEQWCQDRKYEDGAYLDVCFTDGLQLVASVRVVVPESIDYDVANKVLEKFIKEWDLGKWVEVSGEDKGVIQKTKDGAKPGGEILAHIGMKMVERGWGYDTSNKEKMKGAWKDWFCKTIKYNIFTTPFVDLKGLKQCGIDDEPLLLACLLTAQTGMKFKVTDDGIKFLDMSSLSKLEADVMQYIEGKWDKTETTLALYDYHCEKHHD